MFVWLREKKIAWMGDKFFLFHHLFSFSYTSGLRRLGRNSVTKIGRRIIIPYLIGLRSVPRNLKKFLFREEIIRIIELATTALGLLCTTAVIKIQEYDIGSLCYIWFLFIYRHIASTISFICRFVETSFKFHNSKFLAVRTKQCSMIRSLGSSAKCMLHEFSIRWTVFGDPSSNGRPLKKLLIIVEICNPINCKTFISAITLRRSLRTVPSRTMDA